MPPITAAHPHIRILIKIAADGYTVVIQNRKLDCHLELIRVPDLDRAIAMAQQLAVVTEGEFKGAGGTAAELLGRRTGAQWGAPPVTGVPDDFDERLN